MNMIDDVRATDPYPPSRVALDLDAEGRELMEEIMSTTKEKTPLRAHPLRRHGRWVVPVAAAAAVAAVVAGGVVLRGGDDGADPAGPANPGQANPSKSTQQKPAQPKQPKSDPGLPPTAENLHNVVLNDDSWQIENLNNDPVYGGSLSWAKGTAETGFKSAQVTWYQADDYQSYLNDRRADGPGRPATVLGQEGEAFHSVIALPNAKHIQMYGDGRMDPPQGPSDDLRVMTILPPVGDWFLEFDVMVDDEQEYAEVTAALSRVDRDAWLRAIDRGTVTPSEGQAFLDEAGQGVPLPPGTTVTVEDLSLPQSPYQARASFVSKVLCGWADRYVGGDGAALAKLQASKDWAVLQAMDDEGGYPEVTEETVRELADDPSSKYKPGWGCL